MNRKIKSNAQKSKVIGIWIILMSIFISELFLNTWSRVQCIRSGYEITKEENRHQVLGTLQNKLKVELARLKSPERIAEIAKDQFGLTPPAPEQIMVIP